MDDYIEKCPDCGNYVEGKEQRGIVRQAVHDGPEIVVDWIPVGGKLLWKGTKQIVQFLLKTDIQKWGGELERLLYKDIQVEYTCPKCGKRWKETHPMSESEYKQWRDEIIDKAKGLMPTKDKVGIIDETKAMKQQISDNQKAMDQKNLRLQIPYRVVEDFVKNQYQQQISLSYVDGHTVSISKTVGIIFLNKDVSVDFAVRNVAGSDVTVAYDACGVGLIIKGAFALFKDAINGLVEQQEDSQLVAHLGKVPQMKNVFEKIDLNDIGFEQECVNILFSLKETL